MSIKGQWFGSDEWNGDNWKGEGRDNWPEKEKEKKQQNEKDNVVKNPKFSLYTEDTSF